MRILGIETSCDETGAAIVEDGTKILSNIVTSSQEIHVKTGGIIPEVAAREQVHCLIPVVEAAMSNTKCQMSNLNALAVTVGPGLMGSLLVGVETAKTLSFIWQKPLVPVNHLVGHIYANFLRENSKLDVRIKFPAIALIASGGHTELVLMKGHKKLKWVGGTRDDAAGEAFDKIARILGLGYPGGPAIAATAAQFTIHNSQFAIKLPRPMIDSGDFDFSFSGLKTAVLREVNKLRTRKQFNSETIQQLAHEAQEAIVDVLVKKTLKAAQKYQVKSLLLSGGVAANQRLREKIQSTISHTPYAISIPPPSLCTDNAAMVASAGFFNFRPLWRQKIYAKPGLHF